MPQVRLSPQALRDLERLRDFLRPKNPAGAVIQTVQLLGQHPQAGRPDEDDPAFRELVIEFGDSGYVARYYYPGGELVTVTAIRH